MMLSGEEVKINVEKEVEYREVTKTLNEKGMEWYSFEDKRRRLIKIVAKGLYSTCNPTHIVDDLKEKGFKITDASNIEYKKDKCPLPIFML